jgi:hypothetical protein
METTLLQESPLVSTIDFLVEDDAAVSTKHPWCARGCEPTRGLAPDRSRLPVRRCVISWPIAPPDYGRETSPLPIFLFSFPRRESAGRLFLLTGFLPAAVRPRSARWLVPIVGRHRHGCECEAYLRSLATTASDLLVVAFCALAPEEQEEAFAKIADVRLQRLAGAEDETAQFLSSLQRVQQVAGGDLTPDLYRSARLELIDNGEEVAELNAVIRHFGSWRQAKEALELAAAATTPRKIEARFRGRLVGKVHRYREETLRETVQRCAADIGHVPLVIEFEHWRQREIELAKAQGVELFLPSDSPYRRRWGSWEQALLHLGFTPEAIANRLEPGQQKSNESLTHFHFVRPTAH